MKHVFQVRKREEQMKQIYRTVSAEFLLKASNAIEFLYATIDWKCHIYLVTHLYDTIAQDKAVHQCDIRKDIGNLWHHGGVG